MKKIAILLFCLAVPALLFAQKKPVAYQLFTAKGKKVSYKKMLKQLQQADIILFGEHHNNPIAHWMQLEVAQDLAEKRGLILGAEMFETDNQIYLTQYVKGEIDATSLDSLARLWPNYRTDYQPLVELAKAKQLPFIATNIPRRYARMVFRGGFEALEELPQSDKQWMSPLPIAYDASLPAYQKMLEMMGEGHAGENFPKAQAIKDATMAHSILANYQKDQLLFHINGSYHSDDYEGIVWYLKQQRPELTYVTITTVDQKEVAKLETEYLQKADFILCIPENMTKTY